MGPCASSKETTMRVVRSHLFVYPFPFRSFDRTPVSGCVHGNPADKERWAKWCRQSLCCRRRLASPGERGPSTSLSTDRRGCITTTTTTTTAPPLTRRIDCAAQIKPAAGDRLASSVRVLALLGSLIPTNVRLCIQRRLVAIFCGSGGERRRQVGPCIHRPNCGCQLVVCWRKRKKRVVGRLG